MEKANYKRLHITGCNLCKASLQGKSKVKCGCLNVAESGNRNLLQKDTKDLLVDDGNVIKLVLLHNS